MVHVNKMKYNEYTCLHTDKGENTSCNVDKNTLSQNT